jgi:hypothetical protein
MRPYVHSSCIFAVENGCAGPWNAAFLEGRWQKVPSKSGVQRIKMGFEIVRLYSATERLTRRVGLLGFESAPYR